MKKTFLLTILILAQISIFGQNPVQEKAQAYRKANEHQLLQEFMGLLSILHNFNTKNELVNNFFSLS